MDSYGREPEIVCAAPWPKRADLHAALAVRFERVEFVWIRLIGIRFQLI
jgi:hypothetical protein